MAFDFKKEYKEFYLSPKEPQIVTVPKMQFVAVRGKGNPNDENGEYKKALNILYGISYTIKMSKKAGHPMGEYFDYVVPPLEGFWKQDGILGIDYLHKENFKWISLIRLPDFVTQKDFDWAKENFEKKKKINANCADFFFI